MSCKFVGSLSKNEGNEETRCDLVGDTCFHFLVIRFLDQIFNIISIPGERLITTENVLEPVVSLGFDLI